ncbi:MULTISPECIES: copper amine oxidase [unclassified Streptomyces]|uniref:Amine oxidase n=1 Tax=Streptomyces lonegramiae TaxID=3075524 RepID=A0ABU2XBB3_9ACTN|nr:copper amine oxidase [Streptomyces sp. DSM 41529]MDT0543213.1 copper amine oxidase [Streptomyces sp. DSM 41529]
MPERRLRRARARVAAALGASALIGVTGVAAGPAGSAQAAPKAPAKAPVAAADCSAPYRIEQKLDGGTTWRMCWHYESKAGLVLDDVSYQPKGEAAPIKVLTSAKLAQIHVPYDDGTNEYDDLTGQSFAQGLQQLDPAECPGGTIKTVRVPGAWDPDNPDVKGLCATTRARGHAYRMGGGGQDGNKVYQLQGKDLLLYTVNMVGWYEYITEWRFSGDGTMTMQVGATGTLSPVDYDAGDGRGWPIGKGAKDYATSHAHNVFWRLNFGLDGSPKSRIEQYDSKTTTASGQNPKTKTTRTKVTKELAGDAAAQRWWRIVSDTGKNKDGHPRSYEIVPGHTSKFPGRSYTKHDVYFTEYKKCEQFASHNLRNCGAGAGKSVDKWVNGQTLKHPIVWVNIGFHHIARDEDQEPMPVHWQGFQLAPRDVTAMNPLTPSALSDHNGNTQQAG